MTRSLLLILAEREAGPDTARRDADRESQAGQGALYLSDSGRSGLDCWTLGATMTWTQEVELKTIIPAIAAAFGLDVA